MVRHGQGFGETLGLVVYAPRPDWIDVAPVALGLGVDQRVAIYLGGGGEQQACALRLGEAEGFVGAERPDLQRLNRELQVIDGARGAGEVEHALERSRDLDEVRDVVENELKVGVTLEVLEVCLVAGAEIVHADHAVAQGQQSVAQVRAEKAAGAGYEDAHATGRPMLS